MHRKVCMFGRFSRFGLPARRKKDCTIDCPLYRVLPTKESDADTATDSVVSTTFEPCAGRSVTK